MKRSLTFSYYVEDVDKVPTKWILDLQRLGQKVQYFKGEKQGFLQHIHDYNLNLKKKTLQWCNMLRVKLKSKVFYSTYMIKTKILKKHMAMVGRHSMSTPIIMIPIR